ncbi:MAG: ABC transporter [endosymbiont of Galathealinum brachiosum]|uniref:ABC transporter n=1 Tax=endosymbiont of Galathealinum brachiosum TaxID=2200906 RepID=A0A370D9F2_9GAMM|nr:MAG: ABC transporter [endosymbiont of Galathealinum brachiosum]
MNALEITNLQKTYKNGTQALKGVDLKVKEGDFFALLGSNGAGKSTTIGIISGLVNKSAGKVNIFGFDYDTHQAQAKSCIGLVPQEFNFNQFERVIEILVNQAGYYGIPRELAYQRAETYLKQLELWDKRDVMARELSGGMKRRLMIARALIHHPKLLILDEPTAGVDIEIRRSMWDFLRKINKQGTTIILTTHYLEEAESLCKNIAIIDHGYTIEHTSMKALLSQLNTETFILYLQSPLIDTRCLQNSELSPFEIHTVDENTLEINLHEKSQLNELFKLLTNNNIHISSMRNKTNRLEQLFMCLVEKNRNNPDLIETLQQTSHADNLSG